MVSDVRHLRIVNFTGGGIAVDDGGFPRWRVTVRAHTPLYPLHDSAHRRRGAVRPMRVECFTCHSAHWRIPSVESTSWAIK